MRKIIGIVLCMCFVFPGYAKFREGKKRECFVETTGNNEYWFCGEQSAESCDGNKVSRGNAKHWHKHGETFSHNDRSFVCCNAVYTEQKDSNGKGTGIYTFKENNVKDAGRYIEKAKYEEISTPTTIVLSGGGTCTYNKITDTCGNTIRDVPCTEINNCADGEIVFNKKCVKPCTGNQVFFSDTSSTCVDCEESVHQGITMDENGNKYCKKCDETEFFMTKEKYNNTFPNKTKVKHPQCVAKREFKSISKQDMNDCWKNNKTNTDGFRNCVMGISKVNSSTTNLSKPSTTINGSVGGAALVNNLDGNTVSGIIQ